MVSEFKEIFEYLTNNKDEPSIVCWGERSQVQVYANEIMYIEISKRGTKVHTLNKGGMVEKVYSVSYTHLVQFLSLWDRISELV